MNAQNHDDQLLTTGEAARLLGVSVDTVRSLHRQGRLPAIRTTGGQRRFRKEHVMAVGGGKSGGGVGAGQADARAAIASAPTYPVHATPVMGHFRRAPRRMEFLDECDPEIAVAQAELESLRIRHENVMLSRQMEQEAQEAAKGVEAERIAQQTRQRLEDLKVHGRWLASDLPTEWRQQVVSDLETHVTAKDFPPSLPEWEARTFVAARVQQVRNRYLAELGRQHEEAREQAHVEILKWFGRDAARAQTKDWDSEDAEDARREVDDELQRCVRPSWTEADVSRLVKRVLANWEEVDDTEEAGDEDEE